MTTPPVCAHCPQTPYLTTGRRIYPHLPLLYQKKFWLCRCGAYVGCHPNTDRPLGTCANAELRAARNRAHAAFDPLWKSGRMKRGQAYARLAEHFGRQIHIGQSDLETARKIPSMATVLEAKLASQESQPA